MIAIKLSGSLLWWVSANNAFIGIKHADSNHGNISLPVLSPTFAAEMLIITGVF
jgi:hypothetical protein